MRVCSTKKCKCSTGVQTALTSLTKLRMVVIVGSLRYALVESPAIMSIIRLRKIVLAFTTVATEVGADTASVGELVGALVGDLVAVALAQPCKSGNT